MGFKCKILEQFKSNFFQVFYKFNQFQKCYVNKVLPALSHALPSFEHKILLWVTTCDCGNSQSLKREIIYIRLHWATNILLFFTSQYGETCMILISLVNVLQW